jgi:cell wall-associated NlpC family hydrolase
MLNRYLSAPYKDGGRGPLAYDCYGLCIDVRNKLYGLPLLPSLGGVGREKLRANTRAYAEIRQVMEACDPQPGAIASAFRGKHLVHVGVVVEADGQLKVLDTNPGGARISTLRAFESEYPLVVYYRDRVLPQ